MQPSAQSRLGLGPRSSAPTPRLITVGMGDLAVSDDPNAELITHALGSCIAVIVYDPIRHIGGMIHYMLPLSNRTPDRPVDKPAMYADTGVPLLFDMLYEAGAEKRDLVVKVAGGASLNDDGQLFQIGKRNFSVLRKMFWQNQILMAAHDVGGNTYRTARLDVRTGRVSIKTNNGVSEL